MRILTFLLLMTSTLLIAGEFTVNVPFASNDVELRQMANYTAVSVSGTTSISKIGVPALPVANTAIAIPSGTRATAVEVVSVSWQAFRGNCTVLPTTQPVPFSLMDETVISLPVPNQEIYSSSEYFPAEAAEFNGSSMVLGFPVAYVNVYPVRWNPASGNIEVITNLQIKVTTEAAENDYTVRTRSAQSEARSRAIVESTVINPGMVQASNASIVRSQDLEYGEYIIIATTAYESYAQDLADWKTRKGIPTTVVTTNWIQANYSFTDLQQDIRAFLTDCRDNGVEYVLIYGDDNIIAGRDVLISAGGNTEYPPVDLYWSDINDTAPGADLWNSDGDGIWGEYGIDTIDYHPDLWVGRASVNSTSECTIFNSKVYDYEQISPTDYFDSAPIELRMGYSTGYLWDNAYTGDPMYASADAEYISSNYLPSGWGEAKCYESTGNNSGSITIAMINDGPHHIFHGSHGSQTSMYTSYGSDYSVSNIMSQTNISSGNLPAIWNSFACLIGYMDGYECCGDAWLNSPNGGGFGAFNARYGWGNTTESGQLSEAVVLSFYDVMWNDGLYNLGVAHLMGMDELFPPSSEYYDWCLKEYNLFGDPELPLWNADAPQLSASYPSTVPAYTSTVAVTVTANGSPVSGARVCLWKGDDWSTGEVYEVATTNASGVVNISVSPSSIGEMLITAWAQDKISYLGTISVSTTAVEEQSEELISVTAINAPYPNPAVTNAAIPFSLASAGRATVQVFDLSGRTVATPASRDFAAGQNTVNWDLTDANGAQIPNGFYSVIITTETGVMNERIMVIR